MVSALIRSIAGALFAAMGMAWAVVLTFQGVFGLATMRSDLGEFEAAVVAVLRRLSAADPMSGYLISLVLVVLGLLMVFWQPHQERHPTVAPQLYVSNWPPGQERRVKGYLASWSPSDYFSFKFSDYGDGNTLTWPLPSSAETRLTFHLLNVGPGPVRHIRATWEIRAKVHQLVKSSGIFDGFIRHLTRTRLSLVSERAALDRPLASKQSVGLPILPDGQVVALVSPEAFTYAVVAYALAEAKRLKEKVPPPVALQGIGAALDYMDRVSEQMKEILITIAYETEDRIRIRQRFRVTAHMHGNVATMIPGAEENTYVPAEGGVSAWLDCMTVEAI